MTYTSFMDRLASYRRVPVAEAREKLADLINCARYSEERILLTRRGKPVAVLMPLEDAETLAEIEDMLDIELADAAARELEGEDLSKLTSLDDLIAEFGP